MSGLGTRHPKGASDGWTSVPDLKIMLKNRKKSDKIVKNSIELVLDTSHLPLQYIHWFRVAAYERASGGP